MNDRFNVGIEHAGGGSWTAWYGVETAQGTLGECIEWLIQQFLKNRQCLPH